MSATPVSSMETDSNADEIPTNAPPPPPADDDDELFEEAEDEDAETPPSTEEMSIPKNLRDSLGSGRRDAAPAGFTSTKRARKATARFADLEAKGQSYSQAEDVDDAAASSPRPPPRKKKAPPKATTEKKPKRPRAPPAPPTVKRPRNFEERVPATAEQLTGLSIKELKALADKRKVDLTGCAEKGDLVHALVAARVLLPPAAAPAPPSNGDACPPPEVEQCRHCPNTPFTGAFRPERFCDEPPAWDCCASRPSTFADA